MSQDQIRAIIRKQLSNHLPEAFPRPPFEPHLMPVQEPFWALPSAAAASAAYRCDSPEAVAFLRETDRHRRGGVRG